MPSDRLKKLIDCLHDNHDAGCDCAAAYKEFECLAEQAVRGVDIHELLPRVALHLDLCSDCREEFEALVSILGEDNEYRVNE